MKIKKKYFSILVYTSILLIIYGGVSPLISILLLSIIIFTYSLAGYDHLILLPFILYPFMFLIRIPDHENVFLIGVFDIVVVLAIFLVFFKVYPKKPDIRLSPITIFLLLYAFLGFIIATVHALSIEAIPQIFRQFVLPALFTITVINAANKDRALPRKALTLSFFSFTFVGTMAMLNYLNIIPIPPLYESIFPTASFETDLESGVVHGRSILGTDIIPRANLFLGGALGSSAAILATLSVVSLFNFLPNVNRVTSIAFGILLITSAVFSVSFTILLSISVALIFWIYLKKSYLVLLPISVVAVYYLVTKIGFTGTNVVEYYNESFIANIKMALEDNSFLTFLFGNGPKLASATYTDSSRIYAGDIGIFRILLELGIVNFIILLLVIILAIKRYMSSHNKHYRMEKFPYIYIIVVMVLSIHTVLMFTPPFYPLFAVSMAGLFQKGIPDFS